MKGVNCYAFSLECNSSFVIIFIEYRHISVDISIFYTVGKQIRRKCIGCMGFLCIQTIADIKHGLRGQN